MGWLLGAMLCASGQLARARGALREALQYYAEVAQMVRTGEGLLAGDSEKQVAAKLGLSRHTIHVYVKQLYKHYEVSSRAELLAQWVKS